MRKHSYFNQDLINFFSFWGGPIKKPKEPKSPELQAYLISKAQIRRQRIRERNLKLLASGGFKSMRGKP